ncbi:alpha/beta hydrolase [Conservatibacter flavescens]|uniref:Alpha/beta hydrolase n=1 Tax=Conservatibacter flavescens TaxID=28161 RepID=A0A2M8S5D8_9PAST|nr:alpha/beta hydrolase [Conservatibacter flavescens]PJG86344.1 alpha/beta hydrolase [Conservatibacter flavescens]
MKKVMNDATGTAFAQAGEFKTYDRLPPALQSYAKMVSFDIDSDQKLAEINKQQAELLAGFSFPYTDKWTAPAQDNQPAVDLYVYAPKGTDNQTLPTVYYTHGGGYVQGSATEYGKTLQALAERNNVKVVSVEYRLATKAPFPADVQDAYHGLKYIHANADKLGINPDKIIVMGHSAGGGLAARLALYNRDKGDVPIVGQILVYPMLDYRTGSPQSPYNNPYAGEFVWTPISNQFGWNKLRGGQSIQDSDMPYFSPAFAKDVSGLPRTYMMVGDLDLFVNEDIDYANRLIQAGVPIRLSVMPNVHHGFDELAPDLPQSVAYRQELDEQIAKMLK